MKVVASPHSICLVHLHRLVFIVTGSADEPAAALHRLKFGQGISAGSLSEEEAHAIGPDRLQTLLAAFLSQSEERESKVYARVRGEGTELTIQSFINVCWRTILLKQNTA